MSYQLETTAVGNLAYQHDASGRRTQVGGSLAATGFPSAVSSATYDAANELTNWNGTTIGYDANGNIQNDGVASYTWNGRNQLISRGATSFQYDSYGRRILNAGGNNLLYEGWNIGQELSGDSTVASQILGGVDEFFSTKETGNSYSPITDALGSVLGLTNASGVITTKYGYDPFGNTTTSGATNINVFQYTGRENDGDGLYSYRARYYSPAFQSFVSEDPVGFDGGNTNFYAYVQDSPPNLTDPLGLDPFQNFLQGLYPGYVEALGQYPPPVGTQATASATAHRKRSCTTSSAAVPLPYGGQDLYVMSEGLHMIEPLEFMALGVGLAGGGIVGGGALCLTTGAETFGAGCFLGASMAASYGTGGYFIAKAGWTMLQQEMDEPSECP